MEFIDLLKVGANKQEAVIAYNKISEPTIDYEGINMNSILVLLLTCLGMSDSGSDVDADMFGDYSDGMFMLGKSEPDLSYISTKFISLNENKAIITGEYNNSLKIPGIYAVGGCNAEYKKSSLSKMCDLIIERIKR